MKRKILVVDDQPGIRLLLSDILTEHGYDVIVAETGKQALDMVDTNSLALILLDYQLPIMNGSEVIKRLVADEQKIPTILMSGLTENIGTEIRNVPFLVDIVAKPFNIKEICTLIDSVIG